jgi:type IV secretory pathway VirB9-like protein
MKRFSILIASILITMMCCSIAAMAGNLPRTLECDFNGENADKVYKVTTAPGMGTTFRLPDGWKISDFIVTDSRSFHAESNGTIGIVTPLLPNKSTSVSIYTDNDKLFVFQVTSEPDAGGFVDQLVIVQSNNLQFFTQKVKTEAQRVAKAQLEAAEARCSASIEQQGRQIKDQLLFSINSGYVMPINSFAVDKVVDDGIFTYIRLAKSPERPVVYIGEKNDQKKLEPVKYTDEGGYYIVHQVLTYGEKHLYLKLGNQTTEIRRAQ